MVVGSSASATVDAVGGAQKHGVAKLASILPRLLLEEKRGRASVHGASKASDAGGDNRTGCVYVWT